MLSLASAVKRELLSWALGGVLLIEQTWYGGSGDAEGFQYSRSII